MNLFISIFHSIAHKYCSHKRKTRFSIGIMLLYQLNIIAALVGKIHASNDEKCKYLWKPNAQSEWCIQVLFEEEMNWFKAKYTCALQDGFLVEILSREKNKFIEETVKKVKKANRRHFQDPVTKLWIGFRNDLAGSKTWTWDRSSKEMNVVAGARLLKNTHEEMCGRMEISEKFTNTWATEHCRSSAKVICEQCVAKNKDFCYSDKYGPGSPGYENKCVPPCGVVLTKCDLNGDCEKSCEPGYRGPKCDMVCTNSTYGLGCLEKCSPHCGGINKECHPSSGSCTDFCDDNFYGAKCDMVCTNDTYGSGCLKKCSPHCGGVNNLCQPSNGFCVENCEAGFRGQKCDSACTNNTYGPGCLEKCSQHCGGINKECHPSSGSCTEFCDDNFFGPRCDMVCTEETYGSGCLRKCSPHCGGVNNLCRPSNGFCVENCEAGFQGQKCDSACTNNTYGHDCLKKCSSHCGGISKKCHPSNGSCVETCEDGFYGPTCDGSHKSGEQSAESNQWQESMAAIAIVALLFISSCFCFLTCAGFKTVDDFDEDRGAEIQEARDQPFDNLTTSEMQHCNVPTDIVSETDRKVDDKISAFNVLSFTSNSSIGVQKISSALEYKN